MIDSISLLFNTCFVLLVVDTRYTSMTTWFVKASASSKPWSQNGDWSVKI